MSKFRINSPRFNNVLDTPTTTTGTATGGNLVKPRLHLGNAPGRRPTGEGHLAYRLTITGSGQIETPARSALSTVHAGELGLDDHRLFRPSLRSQATVCARHRLTPAVGRTYTGTATEDADDVLVLLTLGV